MNDILKSIESALMSYLPNDTSQSAFLTEAVKYSLMAGGKRIRPRLTVAYAKALDVPVHIAMPFACAVEMIHTYSLIHDDLPCMDDDDMRRGMPSNHIKFGEDIALLAGDVLQSLAFETMLSPEAVSAAGADKAVQAAFVLACESGIAGMGGGQAIDILSGGMEISIDVLKEMHLRKTGALISAACKIGCILGDAGKEQIEAAEKYAFSIGLAFQIVDDILDVTSNCETLGKPVGSDRGNSKSTFVSLLGLEESRKIAKVLTNEAVECLTHFNGDTKELADFANELINRKN